MAQMMNEVKKALDEHETNNTSVEELIKPLEE
jgi:hypothetical protein